MMLIVSSLERAREAYTTYNPGFIISILSEDEERPVFEGLPVENHLKLYVEFETGGKGHSLTAKERTEQIITSFKDADPEGNVLIHCSKGVSRSMAAAYILLCLIQPNKPEEMIARDLRRAAPHADPCLFMVNYADEIMKRDNRLYDAIDDLPPCQTTIDAPIVLLQAAA